nr:MAG TPA: minor tail protein [Caudoviricetes sp.]
MPRNLIIRVGIDASGYSKGLKKVKEETQSVSDQLAKTTAAASMSQRVAPAQAGTSVTDRVGSMLKEGGIPLITDVDVNNIAEARRQAADLAAVMTKLQAKGAAAKDATGPDVEKYWQVKGMYEAITADIYNYDEALRQQYQAQMDAENAAVSQAQAQEAAAAGQRDVSRETQGLAGKIKSAWGSLKSYIKGLYSTEEAANDAARGVSRFSGAASTTARVTGWLGRSALQLVKLPFRVLGSGASMIRRMGDSARSSTGGLSSMVRSLRNISLLSVGLKIAGAAFGRLRSIVSDYISNNAQLQAQVNGLKNGLGQALAPAIGMVVNLFAQLMPYVLGVANAIGSLMGSLFGSAWNKAAAGASKTAAATGSAAKAQKELNNQLLGFDTITRLEDNSSEDSSGGGGGGGGAGATAIEAKTPAWMERFKKSFTDLFASDEFEAANIGGKLGMSLQTALDWLGSEAMNFDWNGVGKKLRANWDSFWNSGAVESLGRTVGIALAGIGDLIIGFMGPAWDEMGQAWKNEGVQGILVYVGGMLTAGVGKLTSGLFTRLISPMFQGMADFFREHGHQSLAGFFQGLADKTAKIGQDIKTHFVDPIVNGVKNLLGIHSPSTVFAGIASYCVEGFTQKFGQLKNKITEKVTGVWDSVKNVADKIKNAFKFNWQLPSLKLPHIQVDWVEAGGVLSKFLGISHIPSLSVKWFAQGGILNGAQLFGRAGSTLLGGGEAGREAVLPLDSNTGWMDKIADRVVSRLGTGNDGPVTINLLLDGKILTSYVIQSLRRQARGAGQPAWG